MAIFPAYSKDEILDYLKQQAPHAEIHVADEVALKYSANGRAQDKIDGQILAYVAVTDVADIQGTLKTARKYHIPVVPQTGDTSTVIGADGIDGAIILSLIKMNRIKEISKDDSLAVVEPGVINGDLDQAARAQGMFYAPDPGSKPISTVGGNVATNAGGMSSVKYGVTKDAILGLKVVLADGREIKIGGRTFKQAYGYDLTHLFIGSEGTLGIVSEITVKLNPIPVGTSVMGVAFFENMTELAKAVKDLRISGIYPVMLEALDGKTVKALDKYEGTNYAKSETSSMLIFRLDAGGQESLAIAEKILNAHQAENISVTSDPVESARLMKLRQDMLPAVFANGNHIMEDMAVPLSKLPEMMDYVQEVARELNVDVYTAGHAGDGNVHPSLIWQGQEEPPAAVIEATRRMFRKALALGGTISGEHAVGMSKNQWTNEELGFDVDEIQHQIKNLFDPLGILNPKRKIN
ncbi:FAD-binding protein [Lactobacillus sp. CC-MHH1034]|uniref:FAD-binding oxidoreductase n=1 Tax=Agrilactobacillus fermenti TaxID=2586909 RepID=UPI001E420C16|nr:FAD-linked oxidase C-terminal domain-containing protein [Agrilactobacillus fermenti]MCD2256932.1 FAD-binding protein [Agrilactobacillus fermenti]